MALKILIVAVFSLTVLTGLLFIGRKHRDKALAESDKAIAKLLGKKYELESALKAKGLAVKKLAIENERLASDNKALLADINITNDVHSEHGTEQAAKIAALSDQLEQAMRDINELLLK